MTKFKLEGLSDAEQSDFDQASEEYLQAQVAKMDETIETTVGQNLKRFRLRRKYKKQDMARFMKVAARTYYAYEEGQRAIPSDALVNLCDATDADLHLLLTGRRAYEDYQVVRAAMADAKLISDMLQNDYPDLDLSFHAKIANYVLTTNWGDLPRMHPDVIKDAVYEFTRFRYFPEHLPSPPWFEEYDGDRDRYERDVKAWQAAIDYNTGEPT